MGVGNNNFSPPSPVSRGASIVSITGVVIILAVCLRLELYYLDSNKPLLSKKLKTSELSLGSSSEPEGDHG